MREALDVSARPQRVLLIDDEDALLRAYRRLLEHAGYRVTTAADGCEAIWLLDTHVFDVVVSDVQMPRMTGLDLLRVLRQRGFAIPVVLVSVTPSESEQAEAAALGVAEILSKAAPELLLDSIRRAVERAGAWAYS